MTQEMYIQKRTALIQEHNAQLRALNFDYAFSNNKHHVGDIIQDHLGYGRVLKINLYQPYGKQYPECCYECEILTVKLAGTKQKVNKRTIHASNIIKNITKQQS